MEHNNMGILVLKFGGSSLATAQRMMQVAEIIENKRQQQRVAVVLSAPAKVTNFLVTIVEKLSMYQKVDEELTALKALLFNLLHDLAQIEPHFPLQTLSEFVAVQFQELERYFSGIEALQQCPDNIHAKIIATGEKFSIAIVSALLQLRANLVTVIDPVQALYGQGEYLEATVDIPRSIKRLQQMSLPSSHILMMAGFTAGNEQGELMVLGRNGSDYSAAVLAACLQATCCEIWTDVDGVYTCDPRIVPNARLLTSLSYQEAMELSYFGANVLHPRTIAPIAQFKIPCLIKNTQHPSAIGTRIGCNSEDIHYPVKGITNLNSMVMLNVSGTGMKGMIGMAARLFSALSRADISVVLITQSSSEYSISFCLPVKDLPAACQVLNDEFYLEIQAGLLEPIDISKGLAIISVVGDGMRTVTGVSARFFTALARGNINIVAIAQGSSERSISVVIDQESVTRAMQACHQMLFDTDQVLNLFILGTGGVGSALINQIKRQQVNLKQKQIELRVLGIANSKKMLTQSGGIELKNWEAALQQTSQPVMLEYWLEFSNKNQLLNPVFIDCTASDYIAESYLSFLTQGFHVITSNKKANTRSMSYYQELRDIANKYQRKFLYDTNVGAGLPVIENLQNLLNAGDELICFNGILSGSLSFIFGLLEEGHTLSEATRQAQQKGFTEPDPRDDLSGTDVARKLLILAREAGYQLEMDDIEVESVIPAEFFVGSVPQFLEKLPQLDMAFQQRVQQAKQQHSVLRYIGIINNGKCSVKIVPVTEDNPLYKIKNGENALAFYTEYYQPMPLVLRGYGAGNEVTAAGIFADMLRTLNNRMG